MSYIPNGGQTYLPVQDNINIPFVPYDPPAKPEPLLPLLVRTLPLNWKPPWKASPSFWNSRPTAPW